MTPLLAGAAGLVVLALLVALGIVSRYKVAGPNEAFLVTGRKGPRGGADLSGQKVVTGGGVFVLPFVQQLARLDLSSRRISVTIKGAPSQQGVMLNLDGVAIVKVGGDEDAIRAAAQRFGAQQQEIAPFTTEALAGALRSIVGTLTVEEIIRDRAAFAAQVAEVTEQALTNQGLILDTFQIQDVTTDGSYLRDLGRAEAARVAQEAAIAEADARRTAEQRRLAAEQDIAEATRTFQLRQAQIKGETDAAAAQAAAAGPIAEAARQQDVLTAQEKVAQKQAALTERQLDTQVRKPADAARYRMEQEAEGEKTAAVARADAARQATIAAAQAAAEQARLTGAGERAKRVALAEAVRLEGDATAAAILANGQAEAQAMREKADAFRGYGDAAVLQMLFEVLPKVAREVAAPMAAIDTLTVISTEGAGALPTQVANGMAQVQQLLKDTAGVDLSAVLRRFEGGTVPLPAPQPA
ncbi:MAG TPA: SPFH domain-containing protein [Mycobacteriales bacterium]|jgi:flotillin|nr:SPFH domain-containing protein [Mycobacteriales bacterium]